MENKVILDNGLVMHNLKILPEFFKEHIAGNKDFEIRIADRDFYVGDYICLNEFYNGGFTGRNIVRKIKYIFSGGSFGLEQGYCVLGLETYLYSWIPVEIRLPDNTEMVLVTCQTQKGLRSINRAYYSEGFWHGSGSMSGVIAWMPLPDPYKSESEEE